MLQFPIELEKLNIYSQSLLISDYEDSIAARLWVPIGRGGGHPWTITLETFTLLFLFSGRVNIIDEQGRNYKLKPGDLVFRKPSTRYRIIRKEEKADKGIEFFLSIPKEIYENLVDLKIIDPDEFIINIGKDQILLDKFKDFIDNLGKFSPKEAPLFNMELMHFIYDLRMRKEFRDINKDKIEKVKKSCKYLSENFEKQISMPECALKFGLEYQNFRKTFYKINGMSPQEFRIRKRIDAAREMIEYSELPLKEIAEKLGYSSFANFALQYKKFTGKSPGSIRKSDFLILKTAE